MRTGFIVGFVGCACFIAAPAGAASSHYLLARAVDQFNGTKSVSFPELTPVAEATSSSGVAGVNSAWFLNRARASSDAGQLTFSSSAAQGADTNAIQPNNWAPAARIEENVTPANTATPTGIRATLRFTATGALTHVTPIGAKLSATLSVSTCQISATRTITVKPGETPVVSPLVPNVGCSNDAKANARLDGALLVVEVTNIGKVAPIAAQIDATITYAGSFTGMIDSLSMTADLAVQPTGGEVLFTSPDFGSKAPGGSLPPDGGPPPASSSSSSSGSFADADASALPEPAPVSPAAPPPSDDGGCAASGHPTAAALPLGLALAAIALGRRRRAATSR